MVNIIGVKKITKNTIEIPEEVMDRLFLNEGDNIAFVEENNKIYLRKTRKKEKTVEKQSSEVPPPPTFEEKGAQYDNIPNMGSNIFDAVQDALKNPEMMKMFQDTAKQLFSAFGDLGKTTKTEDTEKQVEDEEKPVKKADNVNDDKDKDEDDESGFKVKID